MKDLVVIDVGRSAYGPTLRLQERLVEVVRAGGEAGPSVLVLTEHDPPVITLGRSARAEHVLAEPARLAAAGVEMHEVSRGGDVTYHGPGQLVGYPIFRIARGGRGVRGHLRDLEEVVIGLVARLGVTARRIDGLTGVWVGEEKIAAIGVAVRRWVSYHGFALNVAPELAHFDLIVPCGLHDRPVTSLTKILGRPVAIDELAGPLPQCVAEVFGFDTVRPASVEEVLGEPAG